MSFKHQAVQDGANHYVLEPVRNMRAAVHAFLSPALYEASEENMWTQAAVTASYPGVKGVYLMPDCHVGYGIPVGGVVVTEDTILQSGSGYDISCGVLHLRSDLTAADVADWDKRKAWVKAVERRVAFGKGFGRATLMKSFSDRNVENIMHFGAQAVGVAADQCERQYIPVPDDIDLTHVKRGWERAGAQLGTVGGGNHFIELQVDEDDGSVWAMIHCGSRGYGWQTADHYFHKGAALRGLPKNRREESWLRVDEPLGQEYWARHNTAANYAIANRHIIAQGVLEATDEVFGKRLDVYYEISHNLVQEETLLLPNGDRVKGFVHRKGATRAFPAGHPDLKGSVWEATGHPCLIPGSMMDGAAILFPLPGATRSACSVNHGSGRVMARGEAKRKLESRQDEIDAEMREVERVFAGVKIRGIVSNTDKTPLDESSRVYKNLDAVLAVLETEGVAWIERRLWPVANLKGTD